MENDIIALISYLKCAIPTSAIIYSLNGSELDLFTISSIGFATTISGTLLYFLNKYCYTNRVVSSKIDKIRKQHAIDKLCEFERKIKIEDYFCECLGDK